MVIPLLAVSKKKEKRIKRMKEFIINGNKFKTKKAFHKYAESLFTYGLNWETGRNLDAFADILSGG
ncbi:MAG: hypothetical protein AAGI49_10925, partial [Bacteroidota bacterium]